MPTLSASQIAQYAANAGFNGNNLVIAVAVCLAESSGNTQAINHNTDGSTDYGLWQINSVHGLNPADMFDPVKNAAAAYSISGNGVNWKPWSTYNNKAYLAHMPVALASTGGITATPTGNVATTATATTVADFKVHIPGTPWDVPIPGTGSVQSALGGVIGAISFIVDPGNWERLGLIVAGSLVILFAFVKLASDTPAAGALISTGKKVGEVLA